MSGGGTIADRVGILENARLVLADRVVIGWLTVADRRIVEFGEGRAPERGVDLAGDHLVPGLVELHTDHLESHYAPRPGVRWHPIGAVLAYDAQIVASGITTVFDSLRAGSDPDGSGLGSELDVLALAVAARGCIVVCNVSRRVIAAARGTLPGVHVVAVTAAPAISAKRLAARGRPQDGDLRRAVVARGHGRRRRHRGRRRGARRHGGTLRRDPAGTGRRPTLTAPPPRACLASS